MLDFSEGWVWFVCGLSVTLATALFCVALVAIARAGEHRHGPTGT